jgi:hypothetical protein
MKRGVRALVACACAALLCSCVSAVYTRDWTVNSTRLSDTLSISGDRFRLERAGSAGFSTFEGSLIAIGEDWTFEVESWRRPDGEVSRFDPPVRYVYRVKVFLNGLSFLSLLRVDGEKSFTFIPRGDFEVR